MAANKPEETDFGILDFSAEFEVAIEVATKCQQAIGNDATELTAVLQSRTEDVLRLKAIVHPGRASKMREIATSTAAALAAYSKKMENRASELREAWDRVDHFFPKLLQAGEVGGIREQAHGLYEALRTARNSMQQLRERTMYAKESTGDLGKLSGALKLGTKRAQQGLQAVIDQYWRIENSLEQMLALIEAHFGPESDSDSRS